MEKHKKKAVSIKTKLLLIAVLPSAVLSIVLTYLAATNIRAGMQDETLQGLRGIAVSLQEIYAMADDGDYASDESGNIKKGELAVSENYSIVDDLKEKTQYDVTIFYGDTRVTTSLTDHQTKETFQHVTNGVNATREEAEMIEKQATACDTARAKILDIIQNLSAISEENAASTEETTASMEELNATLNLLAESAKDLLELSTGLENDMNFFQL